MDLRKHSRFIEEEIERLSKIDLSDSQLNREVMRAKAMANLCATDVRAMKHALQTEKFKFESGKSDADLPEVLRMGK